VADDRIGRRVLPSAGGGALLAGSARRVGDRGGPPWGRKSRASAPTARPGGLW